MVIAVASAEVGHFQWRALGRRAIAGVLFWAAIVVLLAFAASLDRARRGEEIHAWFALGSYALGFLPWIFLAPLIFTRGRKCALARMHAGATALEVLALVGISIIVIVAHISLVHAPVLGMTPLELVRRVDAIGWTFDVFIFALCFIAGRLDGERTLQEAIANERHMLEMRLLSLEREAASLENRELRSRFSSHFVLNALSNILGLVRTADSAAAAEAVLTLGEILKQVSHNAGTTSTIGVEAEFITAYLRFQRIRYPGAAFELSIPNDVLTLTIPAFLLQPLIENTFKHGLSPEGELNASLKIARTDREITITVTNSLARAPAMRLEEGEGLRLTRARLELCYANRFTLSHRVHDGRYTVQITIPEAST